MGLTVTKKAHPGRKLQCQPKAGEVDASGRQPALADMVDWAHEQREPEHTG